jgi:hypothetical protein
LRRRVIFPRHHQAMKHQPDASAAQRRLWAIGLIAAIAVGTVFRLVWLRDIEFKGDEAGAVRLVQAFWASHHLPATGIPSSTGLPNPGLNLWVLIAISAALPNIGPLEMTRAIQVANVVAILLLAWFAVKGVPRAEREPWLWSVALVSVNPLAVIFSRKLWAQELFPLFTLPMLVGWTYRGRRWGAFLWGFAGALLGQVHLTGFLFAAPFTAVTLLLAPRSVRWWAWLLGSAAGAIPLIPWLIDVATHTHPVSSAAIQNPAIPFGHWVNYALGIDLSKTLGPDFTEFVAFPRIGGIPTYGIALLLAAILVVAGLLLLTLLRRRRIRATADMRSRPFQSDISKLLLAGCVGYCGLLAVMLHPAYLHYLIVAFSLPSLSLAWLALASDGGNAASLSVSRLLLTAMVVLQAVLALAFLCFIHQTQFIRGDYGTTYGSQTHAQ